MGLEGVGWKGGVGSVLYNRIIHSALPSKALSPPTPSPLLAEEEVDSINHLFTLTPPPTPLPHLCLLRRKLTALRMWALLS